MSDLVKRLRSGEGWGRKLLDEAADEIERLTKTIELMKRQKERPNKKH